MKNPQERMYEDMMRRAVCEAMQDAERSEPRSLMLFRKSGDERSPESVATLRIQAQAAESIIGRYGITVWSKSSSPETTPHASMEAIERFFRLENTPPGSEHYTLYFRKPVDLLQADKFNVLFYDQFTPERDE